MANPINIYVSVSKSLILTLGFVVFAILVYVALKNASIAKIIIGGICELVSIIGFGFSLYVLWLALKKRPVIRIYNDRVENYTLFTGWQTIYFCDVEIFTVIKVSGVQIIQAHFLNNLFQVDKSLNTGLIGNKNKVCDLLNEKLNDYEAVE
jgi:hypothetical protein